MIPPPLDQEGPRLLWAPGLIVAPPFDHIMGASPRPKLIIEALDGIFAHGNSTETPQFDRFEYPH